MTGLTVLNVVRSVGLTHQLVNLVREERAVDRGHLEDASVITAADVLKKRMSAFLVEGQQRRFIHLKHLSNGGNIGFRLNRELPDFIDHDDFGFFLGPTEGGNGDALQFGKIQTKTEHAKAVVVAAVTMMPSSPLTMSMIL